MTPFVWIAAGVAAIVAFVKSSGSGSTTTPPAASDPVIQPASDTTSTGPRVFRDVPTSWQVNWTTFDAAFQKYGAQWNVDWTWLKAFAMNESLLGTLPSVANGETSSDGLSWGLMQVTLATAKDMDANATIDNLNDPDYSINIAAKYISTVLVSRWGNNVEFVVKSYNEGPGRMAEVLDGTATDNSVDYFNRWERNLTRVLDNP